MINKINSTNSFWLRWVPAIILMAVIFAFSSIPSKELPHFGRMDLSIKKGGHMLGYALLGQAYLWGLGTERPKARAWAFLLAVLFAASDEFHQSFVAGRGAGIIDVGIDSIGILLGLLVSWMRRTP